MTRRVIFARDWDLGSVINCYEYFVKTAETFLKGKTLARKMSQTERERMGVIGDRLAPTQPIFSECEFNKK